ncbi:MAG: CDP-diacylglycerol--glycerol-3-phosphate 3-phosphatidyltransferase [Oscillospiraceae bacterium]|nr:CDP-diacylglycerol--glycerol-3-phosphate 3-phosphatidyltransferase [Oscillospiraceae bacterium]
MNIANRLTIIRILLVPVFLLFIYLDIPFNYLYAVIVFVIASITDLYDGKLARKYGIVTNFGKFLDPLADKILVISAMIAFIGLSLANPITVILVVTREFVVSGVRLVAASGSGKVIDANWWGKMKTTIQIIVIISILVFMEFARAMNIEGLTKAVIMGANVGMWLVAVVTVISGATYIVQNKELFNDIK